ncbi:MAG: PEPxxWA-CTERM sorting domain-containing protein [Azoarcus sp.]|jgi:hypothetical protein|nr:PEPxxWA-CTERM sorting domain-containing protein [Azoarcus sp.]
MKHAKLTQAAKVAAFVLASGLCGMAQAAIVEGVSLGAKEFVDQFNSKAVYFTFDYNKTGPGYSVKFQDYQFVDFSAYSQDAYGRPNVVTFDAAAITTVNADWVATGSVKLNYNEYMHTTQTNYYSGVGGNAAPLPEQTTLSVGAAYIYTMFVTEGKYSNYDTLRYPWAILTYQDRIRLTSLGKSQWVDYASNPYLQDLLRLNNDMDYWLAPYDPDKLYSEIGEYSVFVMNNTRAVSTQQSLAPNGTTMKNMLFLADMNMNTIPEPETYAMMLAGLGLIGAIARRRRSKNQ